MTTLGLRAEPTGFYWAICEGALEAPILVAVDHIAAPRDYDEAEGLGDLRTRLRGIVSGYSPAVVGLRTPESVSKSSGEPARKRLRVEGVLLATCAECHLAVTTAALNKLSSSLGVNSAKSLLESDQYGLVNWAGYPTAKREAILIGISQLPRETECKS